MTTVRFSPAFAAPYANLYAFDLSIPHFVQEFKEPYKILCLRAKILHCIFQANPFLLKNQSHLSLSQEFVQLKILLNLMILKN